MNTEDLKKEIEEYLKIYMNIKNSYILYKHIREESLQYKDETAQISDFLIIILSDIYSMVLINTCKLLDIRNDKNIFKLLNVSEQNIDIFDNTFYTDNEIKDKIKELKDELDSNNQLINILKIYRDKYLTHIDKDYWGNVQKLFKDHRITFKEIELILALISKIQNELLSMLCNTKWVIKDYGTEEYSYILKSIKEHLENR